MDTTTAEGVWTTPMERSIGDFEHQHWHMGESNNTLSHTTEYEPCDSAASMRRNNNQVGSDALGPIDANRPRISDQNFFGALRVAWVGKFLIESLLGVLQTDLIVDGFYRKPLGC